MTDAELAILSLLSEGVSSDRELSSMIDARGLRKWTAIGYSSMSYVLDKLVRQGLVEVVSEDADQRVFKISSAGIGGFATSVSDLISTLHAYDKTVGLGLADLDIFRPHQGRDALLNPGQ